MRISPAEGSRVRQHIALHKSLAFGSEHATMLAHDGSNFSETSEFKSVSLMGSSKHLPCLPSLSCGICLASKKSLQHVPRGWFKWCEGLHQMVSPCLDCCLCLACLAHATEVCLPDRNGIPDFLEGGMPMTTMMPAPAYAAPAPTYAAPAPTYAAPAPMYAAPAPTYAAPAPTYAAPAQSCPLLQR